MVVVGVAGRHGIFLSRFENAGQSVAAAADSDTSVQVTTKTLPEKCCSSWCLVRFDSDNAPLSEPKTQNDHATG